MEDNTTMFWVKVIGAVAAGIALIIGAVLKARGSSSTVVQKGNQVGGDMAGRDIKK